MIPQFLRKFFKNKNDAIKKVSAEKPKQKFNTTLPDNPLSEKEWKERFNRYYTTGKN